MVGTALKTAPLPVGSTFACETEAIPGSFEILFSSLTRSGSEAVDLRKLFCWAVFFCSACVGPCAAACCSASAWA